MSNDDPKGVRDTLLDDYARKDALLQTFRETGAYSSDPEQYMLPIRHVRMNATLVLIAAWTCWVAKFVLGWSLRVVTRRVGISFVVLFLMHAFTHLHAERISGASRVAALRDGPRKCSCGAGWAASSTTAGLRPRRRPASEVAPGDS